MVPCDGTATSDRWCCGTSTNCCTSNFGVVQLAQVLGGTLSSVVRSASTTLSSTPTTLSSAASSNAATTGVSTSPASTDPASGSNPSTSSSSDSGSGSKLSGGAIAGIVIGALAGVALLAAAIFFARRAAMWKKNASAASPYTQHTDGYGPAAVYEATPSDKYAYTHRGEMDGSTPVQELPGDTMNSKLPSDCPEEVSRTGAHVASSETGSMGTH